MIHGRRYLDPRGNVGRAQESGSGRPGEGEKQAGFGKVLIPVSGMAALTAENKGFSKAMIFIARNAIPVCARAIFHQYFKTGCDASLRGFAAAEISAGSVPRGAYPSACGCAGFGFPGLSAERLQRQGLAAYKPLAWCAGRLEK